MTHTCDFSVSDINMASASVVEILEKRLNKIAERVEQQVDDELDRLEKLDSDDLEKLREQRLNKMKQEAQQRQEWRVLVRNLRQSTLTTTIPYSTQKVSAEA
jgi:ribosome-associated translation inhibitor RaiA